MDSTKASVYRLQNDNGMEVLVSAYGGIIQRLTTPDCHGRYEDVVLGETYLSKTVYKFSCP
jgi:aldose 1-epimerase